MERETEFLPKSKAPLQIQVFVPFYLRPMTNPHCHTATTKKAHPYVLDYIYIFLPFDNNVY